MPRLFDETWTDLAPRRGLVALLPLGAVEAHGPHLPLGTDVVIAEAMAREAEALLLAAGLSVTVMPTLSYAPAPFAADFPGTISLRPSTLTALLVDIGRALSSPRFRALVLVNSHFDPAHLGAIYQAIEELRDEESVPVVFPDVTRRSLAARLTEEFQSGACHAGRYEGSIVLAERPGLVREQRRQLLPDNPASLSRAIRRGESTFAEAGGPDAYFGQPSAATAKEGRETIEVLGRLVFEAVTRALEEPSR